MKKIFFQHSYFITNLIKCIFVIVFSIFMFNAKEKFLIKVFSFITKSILYFILSILLLITTYCLYYWFCSLDVSNYFQDIMDYKDSIYYNNKNNYNMLDLFSNKSNSYFPSSFVKNNYLYSNFTFQNISKKVVSDIVIESENYFLWKQSYTFSELKNCNNEIFTRYKVYIE